jgi:hypothetical protein
MATWASIALIERVNVYAGQRQTGDVRHPRQPEEPEEGCHAIMASKMMRCAVLNLLLRSIAQ